MPQPPTVSGHCQFRIIGATLLLAASVCANAADIMVLSGSGAKAAVTGLAAQFERATGHKVSISFGVAPAIRKRIEAARALVQFLASPEALPALEALGVER